MKTLIPENIAEKVYFYSMIFLALSIPFQLLSFPPTLGIIVLTTCWTFSSGFKEKFRRIKENTALQLILVLFFLSFLYIFHSNNPQEGWKDVLVKIPLFLLPLVLGTIGPFSEKRIRILLLVFSFTVACGAAFLLFKALFLYTQDGNTQHFFHHNLADFQRVPIHYFAMYCTFSFFIMLFYLLKDFRQSKTIYSILKVFALLLLLTILFFTAVRIQMVAFIIAMGVFILWYYGRKRKWKSMVIVFLLLSTVFSVLIFTVPGSRKRIQDAYIEWQVLTGENIMKQTNHRVYIWADGIKVIKENIWVGTGTGAANDALYEKIKLSEEPFYDGENYYTLAKKKYNFHNEFLQHFATYGILGFIFILAVFTIPPLYILKKDFQLLPLLFILISLISFSTESMLERQAGNMFFGFFYGLLIASRFRRKSS